LIDRIVTSGRYGDKNKQTVELNMNMLRKTLTWANKEVETFLCILGEEDVQRELDGAVFIVFNLFIVFIEQATLCRTAMMSRCLRSCRGDRHPAYHKGYCRRWKRDFGTELGYTAPSLPD
jgi:hypothetical protein